MTAFCVTSNLLSWEGYEIEVSWSAFNKCPDSSQNKALRSSVLMDRASVDIFRVPKRDQIEESPLIYEIPYLTRHRPSVRTRLKQNANLTNIEHRTLNLVYDCPANQLFLEVAHTGNSERLTACMTKHIRRHEIKSNPKSCLQLFD